MERLREQEEQKKQEKAQKKKEAKKKKKEKDQKPEEAPVGMWCSVLLLMSLLSSSLSLSVFSLCLSVPLFSLLLLSTRTHFARSCFVVDPDMAAFGLPTGFK